MRGIWKKKAFVVLVAVLIGGWAPGLYAGEAYAEPMPCLTDTLGGEAGEGNLQVIVDAGNIDVYRYNAATEVFEPQYHTGEDGAETAAVLKFDDSLYVLGAGGDWGKDYTAPLCSQTKSLDGTTVETTWYGGAVEIIQRVTLPADTPTYIKLEWEITNYDTGMEDIHFFRGVNTTLGGESSGDGFWNEMSNTIGASKRIDGVSLWMGMKGETSPVAYASEYNDAVQSQIFEDYALENRTANQYDEDEEIDNAYALEWSKVSQEIETPWKITAYEGFGDIALIPSGDSQTAVPGEPVTLTFNITNSGLTEYSFAYDVDAPDGWTAEPDKETDTLLKNASTSVNVLVTPSETAESGDYEVNLRVGLAVIGAVDIQGMMEAYGTVTLPAESLLAPADVAATAGDGEVSLSWTPVDGATGYKVFQSAASDSYGGKIATVTDAVYRVTGLTNGTTYYFAVKAYDTVSESVYSNQIGATPVAVPPPSGNGGSGGNTVEDTGVDVLVNGKAEKAGTMEMTQRDGQTVATVAIDPAKLADKLAAEGQHAVVTIPVNVESDVVIGELNGEMVKNMEDSQAVLEIKTEKATYTLPAQQINIDAISEQIGRSVDLQDIKVQIEIAASTDATVQIVENAAAEGSFAIVVPPLDFKVSAVYGDTVVDVDRFNAYVERTIAIPEGVDPNKITTGVVVDPDGTARHVPTKVVLIDGKYYAKINSLTNSTYSVVWHPLEFSDVADHWAKEAVNDMGSRMVVKGVGDGLYDPDEDVTRAEFAAIVVRGLGLKPVQEAAPFPDVSAADWYGSAVATAYSYHLISGFEDGTFRPDDNVTREEAMVIVAKAMEITGLKGQFPVQPADETLQRFTDAADISGWALDSIVNSVQAGVVSGRNEARLAPKGNMTRAEVAMIVQKLLQKADLI